jgi:hypothetical protein
VVLVFALVIGATTTVVVIGGSAINDTRTQLDSASAEKAMTQLDSQASLVALGQSQAQTVELGSTGSNNYTASDSAGSMSVVFTNASTDNSTTLMETDMGEIVYAGNDGSRIAYQGGGVWRSGEGGGTVMVSPPELRYRGGTLTLPLVTVSNDTSIRGDAVIKAGKTTPKYPNETLSNPLSGGSITITIQSDYHEGWNSYLESRTEGTVTHYPGNQTVEITLTVPVEAEFENSVATVAEGGLSNEAAFETPFETGVNAPVPDSRIDSQIEDCEANGCTELSGSVDSETFTEGTYNASGSTTLTDVTYDTDGAEIDVVIDGDLTFDGTHEIEDGGNVTFYVKGDITIKGNSEVNTGGDPNDLLLMVHSEGDSVAASSGTPQLTGLVYAPGSDFVINGGGKCGRGGNGNGNGNGGGNSCEANVVGSIVANTADGGGNGDVNHAGSISRSLDFTTDSAITYLHVSENEITVTE